MSDPAEGRFSYTKPAEEKEARSLQLGIQLHQGDRFAAVPGALYGSATLTDDKGNIVHSVELSPADLKNLLPELAQLKERLLADISAVFSPG